MSKPAVGKIFHQCVYVLCERDEPLLKAAASARRKFGLDDTLIDYMPHISLLYSDIDFESRYDLCWHQMPVSEQLQLVVTRGTYRVA